MPLPADVVGKELDSIAAVIIGIGGSKKGKNIVIGTFLGVLLLEVISTNLVMLGVPSYWQQLVSGIIILLGLCLQAVRFDQK
jgi:simple sugar transport system permease protein